MSFSKLEIKNIDTIVGACISKRRPPLHIRPKLDLAYRIKDRSVEIMEISPDSKGKPGETMGDAVAKATYIKARNVWRVYWKKADLKWHSYEPAPQVNDIEQFLTLVAEDKYSYFFG